MEKKFNIVIVDDLATNIKLIVRILESNSDYNILTFTSSVEASKYIKENYKTIDLLILDIMMPEITGLELCKKIKSSPVTENIPVILVTAKGELNDIVEGLESGAEDYITKPFRAKELKSRIKSAIRARKMYLELLEKNQTLNELNELKDYFLSMASHDIRNNLTGIIGNCNLILLEKYGNLNPKYKQFLNVILKRSKSITNLVNTILDAAKLENGKLELYLSEVNVNDFLEQYFQDISLLYRFEQVEFELEIAENLPVIKIDTEKIDEVLTNLVTNALKFTPSGGKITIGARKHSDKNVLFFVRDTGIGINKSELPKIFEKFSKISNKDKIKVKYKSTGLGLSICKGLVKLHNGEIFVDSEEDKGSEFKFTIPI